jgi:hypothetical protein
VELYTGTVADRHDALVEPRQLVFSKKATQYCQAWLTISTILHRMIGGISIIRTFLVAWRSGCRPAF